MSNSLLEKYKLQKRLDVIESLIIERSVGRGGEPSNAMKVWRLLTDNGPMTRLTCVYMVICVVLKFVVL